MDANPETARPPLPWEQNAAIVCLALLTLMEIHEGILFCLGKPAPGFHETSLGFALFILFFTGIGCGLRMQSRVAWYSGVIIVGIVALVHAAVTWPAMIHYLSFSSRVGSVSSYQWYEIDRLLEPFEVLWLGIRSALLFAVPAFLMAGVVRTTFAPPRREI